MNVRIASIGTSLLAATLVMAGCAAPSPTTGPSTALDAASAQGASLNLAIQGPPQTQTLLGEVDTFKVTLAIGTTVATRDVTAQQAGGLVSLDALPAGAGTVKVEALRGQNSVGLGFAPINLTLGARSYVTVRVALTQAGNTEWMPAAPLGMSLVSPASSLEGRFLFNLPSAYGAQSLMLSPNSAGNPGVPLVAQLKYATTSYGTYTRLTATESANANGYFGFTDLADGFYQVLYDDATTVADTSFNTVAVAVGEPVPVTSTQSRPAFTALDLGWDFTRAYPMPNQTVATGSVVFKWAPKSGYSDAYYQVTVYPTSMLTNALASSNWSNQTAASMSIPAEYAGGTHYYVVKYARYGSFGSANYYGQTRPIPFQVQ